MNRAETAHVSALLASMQAMALLPPGLEDELTDGFTTAQEAYEQIAGIAKRAGVICETADAPSLRGQIPELLGKP